VTLKHALGEPGHRGRGSSAPSLPQGRTASKRRLDDKTSSPVGATKGERAANRISKPSWWVWRPSWRSRAWKGLR
jgi:hypothetical protein